MVSVYVTTLFYIAHYGNILHWEAPFSTEDILGWLHLQIYACEL